MKTNLYHIYPTMKCNLDCQHCFLFSDVRKNKEIMTMEQFKVTANKLAQHFKEDADSHFADLTIIGGEPTTVPARFYEEALPYLREQFDKVGKNYLLSFVTNFTNTKGLEKYDNYIDVVTTSYEYDRFDAQLITAFNSKKTIWWSNLESWLEKGKKLGLSISLTKNTGENIIECLELLYAKGVRYFQFNYMHPDGELLKGISTPEYYKEFQENRKSILTDPSVPHNVVLSDDQTAWGGFELEASAMIQMFDWWMEKMRNGVRDIQIYPITAHVDSLSGKLNDELLCPSSGALCVRTDGAVTGCTIEAGQSDMITYGNIFTEEVSEIMASPVREAHISSLNTPSMTCFTCDYYSMCKGNCKFRDGLWDGDPETECQGLKSYLNHVNENLSTFSKLYSAQQSVSSDF